MSFQDNKVILAVGRSRRMKGKPFSINFSKSVLLILLIQLLIITQFVSYTQVSANNLEQTIEIIEPDISNFPQIQYTLKVLDSNQQRLFGLEKDLFEILENDNVILLESLSEIYSGIHTILAINADKELDKRDDSGVSKYQKLLATIIDWQSMQEGREGDLWSLIVNQGRLSIRLDDRDNWLSAIENYQPDMRNAVGNLASLKAAIDSAALNDTEMDQVLLYITPALDNSQIDELKTLTQHAVDKNLHVHTWMLGRESILFTDIGKALLDLAQKTNGSFFIYDGIQPNPDPAQYFYDLGSKYILKYKSKINTSGTHNATIRLNLDGEVVTTEGLSFYVDIQPPVPVFIEPPMILENEVLVEKSTVTPLNEKASVKIEVAIDFPDGHPRSLRYIKLFVNDQLIQENRETPYGIFQWDYSNITEDTIGVLQVELEDELGLKVTSPPIPVEIKIKEIKPEPEGKEFLIPDWLLPVIFSMVAMIALGYTVGKIIDKKRIISNNPQRTPNSKVMVGSTNKKSIRKIKLPAYAILERISADGQLDQDNPIVIKDALTILGSNPIRANIRLTDPSISGVHARIKLLSNGKFFLSDMGSNAGTWLNNAPVSEAGTPLEDGDILKIGRVAFKISIKFRTTK